MQQLKNMKGSEASPTPLPVLPLTFEERCPNRPDSRQVTMEKELINRPVPYPVPFISNSVGPIFSSNSGVSTDLQYPPVAPHEKHPRNSPFVSQSASNNVSFQMRSFPRIVQVAVPEYSQNDKASGRTDPLDELYDFPVDTLDQNNLGENSSVNVALPSEDLGKFSNRQEWADQKIREDANWSDLHGDANISNPEDKIMYQTVNATSNLPVPQVQQPQQVLPSLGEVSVAVNPPPAANTAPVKPRMRWTPELHEAFVKSVAKLGGCERATPKGVLKLMKVEGITVYHVKIHLQKYRTARYRTELTEGSSERRSSPIEEMPSFDFKASLEITEALCMQMEVQKRLHEQLEIQRKLQLQIEEQGRVLQTMFEKQSGFKLQASLDDDANPAYVPGSPNNGLEESKDEKLQKFDSATAAADGNPFGRYRLDSEESKVPKEEELDPPPSTSKRPRLYC